MECLIGIQCDGFVLIAADMTAAQSIILMKDDLEKIHKISSKILMAIAGEQGDTSQFSELIAKNIQLYKMRNNYELSPYSTAFYTRKSLAESLRTAGHYRVNLMLAGYDDHKQQPELYYLDYLAAMVKLPYYAYGYGGFFSNAILDRNYRPNLTEQQAYDLLKLCIKDVQKRLIINLPNFYVKIIDKDGIRDLPNITNKTLES